MKKYKVNLIALMLTFLVSRTAFGLDAAVIYQEEDGTWTVVYDMSVVSASEVLEEFVTDEVIVKTIPEFDNSLRVKADRFGTAKVLEVKALDSDNSFMTRIMSREPEYLLLKLENKSREGLLSAVEELRNLPNIEIAEPNYIFSSSALPTDPGYAGQYALPLISMPAVWNLTVGFPSVTVAILDSGIERTHEDLAANLWVNTGEIPNNGLDDDNNGYIDDVYGWNFYNDNNDNAALTQHGVLIAGIIGAERDNGKGGAGVVENVKLCGLRIFDGSNNATLAAVINAINYAKNNGMKIANMSFGTTVYVEMLESLMRDVPDMLFVCSAGNAGTNNDLIPQYPASFNLDNVISVANTDASDILASTSCYGNSVHIAAPGDLIYGPILNNKYTHSSGTSFAAPHVTGAAALIKAVNPDLSPRQIRDRIIYSGDPVNGLMPPSLRPDLNNSKYILNGTRLNVFNSLTPLETAKVGLSIKDEYIVEAAFDIDSSSPVTLGVALYAGSRLDYLHIDSKESYDSRLEFEIDEAITRIVAFTWENTASMKPIDCKTLEVSW